VKKQRTLTDMLEGQSKSAINQIIRHVGDDQKKFDGLMNIFFGNEPDLARRAGWAISYIACSHPALIKKHFPKIIALLKTPGLHPAMYRSVLRFLEEIRIPAAYNAVVFDLAVKFVLNATHTIAVRAFALTTAANVVKVHPELAGELRIIILHLQEESSAALRVRCRDVLKMIDQLPKENPEFKS
jgi:hypothetical protein